MDSELLGCDHIPSVQYAFWASDCCGGSSTARVSSATCPILHRNTESNQIRRRRAILRAEAEDMNVLSVNEDKSISKIKEYDKEAPDNPEISSAVVSKLDEMLVIVKELESRIENLETKCENESKPEVEDNSFSSAILKLFS